MGNMLGRRRQVVDERFTKPQGLYVHKDVDIKKLRKLILESKLAPCYPGDEELCVDHEECPICFLYYPSLNRSRCCMKGICTECFLQMKNPNSARPTQCPFCKTSNYAVEYRGVKTKEEKGLEQIEEQRVIEAKIRMRQHEIQEEEESMQKRQELSTSSSIVAAGEVGLGLMRGPQPPVEREDIISSQESFTAPMIRHLSHLRANRDDEFDVDLEDIMVMEAIWLSIQENNRHRAPSYGDVTPSEQFAIEGRCYVSPAVASTSSSSPSGGLACAIAALAELQQTSGESSINHNGTTPSLDEISGSSSTYYNRVSQGSYAPAESLPDNRIAMSRDDGEWVADRGSEVAEAGTSYASSDVTEDTDGINVLPQEGNGVGATGPLVPESYEEQMILAMAVSLAEARVMTSGPEVSWQ